MDRLPMAVGFGISTREHVLAVGAHADGVVVGSALIAHLEGLADPTPERVGAAVQSFVAGLCGGPLPSEAVAAADALAAAAPVNAHFEDKSGVSAADMSFGKFGGRYDFLLLAFNCLFQSYPLTG